MIGRLVLGACLLWLAPLAGAVTLKVATIAPDGTAWMREMREGAEQVARRTQGRVKFRFYPGGVMGSDKSMLRKLRIRQLQGAALSAGALSEIHRDAVVYGLPFLFRSTGEVDAIRSRLDPVVEHSLRDEGYVSFGLIEGGFAYLMSDRALRTVDDLRAQRAWVPEGDVITRAAFEAVGVSPISLPLTDVLTGLQTGLVDTVASSPTGAIALQWHTRLRYLTDVPLAYLYGALVIDRKTLERLSVADRRVVEEVMRSVSERLNRQSRQDNEGAREALRREGITFVVPTQAGLARWEGLVKAAIDRLGQEGVYDPRLLARARQLVDEYRAHSR
jgi:TRAP-type C4-dicarboxylate transport system substrate-binding protein